MGFMFFIIFYYSHVKSHVLYFHDFLSLSLFLPFSVFFHHLHYLHRFHHSTIIFIIFGHS